MYDPNDVNACIRKAVQDAKKPEPSKPRVHIPPPKQR